MNEIEQLSVTPVHQGPVHLFKFFPPLAGYTETPCVTYEEYAAFWLGCSDWGQWLTDNNQELDVLADGDFFYIAIKDPEVAMRFKLTFC